MGLERGLLSTTQNRSIKLEVNKYKIIISNKNIYEEIEIPVDAKVYRVGTSIL